MIRTLLHRAAVATLDTVIDRGRSSGHAPVRLAADTLDRLRGVVGLDRVPVREPLPEWDRSHPDQPMWGSDREKLHRFRVDRGIIKPETEDKGGPAAAPPAPAPVIKVYFRRGCPYSRAALDLLREREVPFTDIDMTDDRGLQDFVARLTGRSTSPQILIHERPIGGFDELRELDQSGDLKVMIDSPPPPVDAGDAVIDAILPGDAPTAGEVEITVAARRERQADGQALLLLDVRNPDEWQATGVLPGAHAIALGELEARAGELDPGGVWVVYCRSGKRSLRGREILQAKGFRHVVSLRGGILAWTDDKGPVVRLEEAAAQRPAPKARPKKVSLPVVHPERSPFEGLDFADGDAPQGRLDGQALVDRVLEVLDEVRPMVQADGGDIELLDIQADVVAVKLTGNCIGCPSSQATLRQGIERRLKQKIPQIKGISSPQLQPLG